MQDTLGGGENGKSAVLYSLPKSKFREKGVFYWKDGFLEEWSQFVNINFNNSNWKA